MSSAHAEGEQLPIDSANVDVDQLEQADDAFASSIEVTLLVPPQSFLQLPPTPASKTSDGFLELPFTSALTDIVSDLRNIIVDAPEGFWLGAFSLAPYYAEEIQQEAVDEAKEGDDLPQKQYGEWKVLTPPPAKEDQEEIDLKAWNLTSEGVLGDFADLSGVFGAEPEFWEGKKRGLKVTFTAFSPITMHHHLLKVRDVLFSNLPTLAATTSTYDPTTLAIGAGASLYSSVRGEQVTAPEAQVSQPEEVEEKPASGKGKKGKPAKKAAPAPAPAPEPTPAPASVPSEPSTHAFTNWTLEDLEAANYIQHLTPSAATAATSPCIKSLGVSPWSPPPHARRLRGDIIYLTVQTLESESYTLTGSTSGFWISKTTASIFDPSPRVVLPRGVRQGPYHSLFELLADLSPSFRKNLASLLAKSTRSDLTQSELVASLAITNTLPAAPFLVPAPSHAADPFRTQAAYLLTGSTTAEQLPNARDWNDEFGQFQDLPHSTLNERLLRERLICRTQADFVLAATRGALQIARGDVPPLNPNEPASAHTYIHNNLLFTKAEDSTGLYANGLGGDEASRYAAGKDLKGIELLERLDVDGLSSMQTVLVDYLGARWIVQSLIPGLFKAARDEADELAAKEQEKATGEKVERKAVEVYPVDDEEAKKAAAAAKEADKPFPSEETPNKDDYPPTSAFRIVYGAANPEIPDEKVRSSTYFHEKLAKQVAKGMRFAEHMVKDQEGREVKLWTASDMHGIAAPDGRSYFIDCFRLHCVDVEFREQDVAASDNAPAYPHRLVLLRPELLEAFRESKLQKWLEEQVQVTRAKIENDQKSIEAELKEAATDSTAAAGPAKEEEPKADAEIQGEEKKVEPTTSVINADDFVLNFNPDAFVERKPSKEAGESLVIYDAADPATENVRLASQYLREVVLKEFLVEAAANSFAVTDGFFLTKVLHRKGINMRYLGALVEKIDKEGADLDYGKTPSKNEAQFTLNLLRHTFQSEMVVRAAKHILNRLLRAAPAFDQPFVVAHFLNCLLGASLNASPVAETPYLPSSASVTRTWTSLTPASLRADLVNEIHSRFRYALPETWFDADMLKNKVARELCLRVGVQLVARPYDYGSSAVATPAVSSDAEKGEAVSNDAAAAASSGKNKKKKKSSKAVNGEQARADLPAQTFSADDVLNIMPVVKSTVHKSSLVDDNFVHGQRAIGEGQVDVGEAVVNESLHLCEQIFGAVHPEAAQKYHALGIVWHNLSQRVMQTIRTHEFAEQALKELEAEGREDREEDRKQIQELIIPNVEAARNEAETYLQQAVRMMRQSIVITERVNGVDSHDAIQQYSDLGLLEQAAGNVTVGLKLTKHAMDLWTAAYGPRHPTMVALLSNVAAMVQGQWGPEAAISLQKEYRKLAELVYGADSVPVGQAELTLGQTYALVSDLPAALEHMKVAQTVLSKHLGDEAKEVQEAANLVRFIEASVAREGIERAAREERLKKKFPQLVANRTVGGAAAGPSGAALGKQPASTSALPTKREHGQKASLSVDELVSFIEGPSSSKGANRKRKPSP
ncbi:hypothetical protein JCM1841_005504 [Sporobolomyces salmonicolor]